MDLSSSTSQLSPVEAFKAYPFDLDQEFQAGLQSILSTAPPSTDVQALEEQAKLFYFNQKTGLALTLADVTSPTSQPTAIVPAAATLDQTREGDASPQAHEAAPPSAQDAPYPLSFAQLAELIQTNRTDLIPNNDIVPNTILEGQASQSTMPARRKPWEVAAPIAEARVAEAQEIAQQH